MLAPMLLTFVLLAALADPLASAQQGARIVERALEAHGSADPKVSLSIRADQVTEGQSLVALPPFETYPYRMDVTLDPAAKRLRVVTQSAIAGDFAFGDVLALQDGKGFSLTPEVKEYREVTSEPPVLNPWFPHRRLKQVLTNRTSLRAVDDHTVTTGSQTFIFDPKTHLLQRVQQVASGTFGDTLRETRYEDYRKTGDALLPSRVRVRMTNAVHGTVENVFRYEDVKATAEFAATDFTLPEGYRKPDYSYRGQFEAKTLADGVWLLENISRTTGQWSYNVLAVAFDEFVLVTEAPLGSETTERVLEKIRELAPGKPVRYLVQSHHHSDHIGGIRPYVAEGTTILTGATAKPLVEKMAAAPFALDPDRLHRSPKAPKIEVVDERRTITDGKREAVVINIGPNPHARDMLIVHLPKEKILWQSDMINEGEYPANAATADFREKVKGLEFETVVGLHGKVHLPHP
jgi:glyoxylase-like metal-dependent hydrolase (beta-lactamase superfamily II)